MAGGRAEGGEARRGEGCREQRGQETWTGSLDVRRLEFWVCLGEVYWTFGII